MEIKTIRAKINLTLDVEGTDNGIHLLRSLFLQIPLHASGKFWEQPGLFRIEDLPIVYSESKAFKTYLKKPCSAHIFQSVPTGYGLGGSAADDALIASYTHVEPSSRDAYFLMSGYKLALVEGDQTIIYPLPLPFSLELMLVFPPSTSYTSALFSKWDRYPVFSNYTQQALKALNEADKEAFERSFGNVLENYIDDDLKHIRDYLLTCGPFVMTGSGSSFFAPLNKVKKYPNLPFKILFIERWLPK
jgi:4-diphosphocytidyl-2-C-methyl-D-erythritol kinase